MSLRAWQGRVERALKRHGPLGSTLVVARFAIARLRGLIGPRADPAAQREIFDAQHGIDTGGRVSLSDLSVDGEAAVWGNPYQSVSVGTFESLMRACGVEHERYVFVDFGSGKGRALLLASHYPFRHIVGVELAPELHAVAERNLAKYRHDAQRCMSFELRCGDVTSFPLPPGPSLVYMYNPFEGPVMRRTATMIGEIAEDPKREIVVAYVNPRMAEVFDALPGLRRVATDRDYVVWHSRGVIRPSAEPAG